VLNSEAILSVFTLISLHIALYLIKTYERFVFDTTGNFSVQKADGAKFKKKNYNTLLPCFETTSELKAR
jgi:hypothetical protein